jgi:hypothetical protein
MFKLTAPRLQSLLSSLGPTQQGPPERTPNILQRTPTGPGGLKKFNELQRLEGNFTQKARDFEATAATVSQFEQEMSQRQQAFESGAITKPDDGTFAFELPTAAASKDLRANFQSNLEKFSRVLNLSGQVFQGAPGEFQNLKQMLQKAIQAQQSVAGTFSGMTAASGEAAGLSAFQASAQGALAPSLAAAGEFSQSTIFPFFTRAAGSPTGLATSTTPQKQAAFFKSPNRRL